MSEPGDPPPGQPATDAPGGTRADPPVGPAAAEDARFATAAEDARFAPADAEDARFAPAAAEDAASAPAADDARFAPPPDPVAEIGAELPSRPVAARGAPRTSYAPPVHRSGAHREPSSAATAPPAPATDLAARRHRRWLALLVFVASLTLVLINQRRVGIVRDEVVYVGAGKVYARWWLDLAELKSGRVSEAGITRSWGGKGTTDNNREHPPLMKSLFGLSQIVLHDQLGISSEIGASRAATAAVHALAIAILFAWVAACWGLAEGLIAALCALMIPRGLFHAGIACFDAPIASWWLLTLYAYWRGLSHRGWALLAGVVWGLALATKHNALLIPFAIAPHFVWVAITRYRRPGQVTALGVLAAVGRGLRERWTTPVGLIVLGPVTLVALWPWLWFDTVDHLRAWLHFHTSHVHYNFEYLGDNWNHPPFPWHTAIVTTLLTVPMATIVASVIGAARGVALARRGVGVERGSAPGVLLALSLVVAIGPFLLGGTPIFGAEKHWMVVGYTIAAGAGLGVAWAGRLAARAIALRWSALPARRVELATLFATAVIVVGAATAETLHAQPYSLSSYNALAGGAPGGADLGMNRQFWGYAARGVLPTLRSLAPPPGAPPAPVYTHDATPAWGWYRKAGRLPASLPDAGHEQSGVDRSQLAIVIHERHFNRHDFMVWAAYGTVRPVFVLRFDGVPLVSVYRRPAPP